MTRIKNAERFPEPEGGRAEHSSISLERVVSAFFNYVENDLEAAEPDYVESVLRDVCGLTDEEMHALGFDEWFGKEKA